MKTAWYEAGVAFLLFVIGVHDHNGVALFFAGLWTFNCWVDQRRVFEEEDDRERHRSNGEDFGEKGRAEDKTDGGAGEA